MGGKDESPWWCPSFRSMFDIARGGGSLEPRFPENVGGGFLVEVVPLNGDLLAGLGIAIQIVVASVAVELESGFFQRLDRFASFVHARRKARKCAKQRKYKGAIHPRTAAGMMALLGWVGRTDGTKFHRIYIKPYVKKSELREVLSNESKRGHPDNKRPGDPVK